MSTVEIKNNNKVHLPIIIIIRNIADTANESHAFRLTRNLLSEMPSKLPVLNSTLA